MFDAITAPQGSSEPATASKRKRQSTDIGAISKFKTVCLSEGIPKLHAMVQRNPVIMYPPDQPLPGEQEQLQDVIADCDAVERDGAKDVLSDAELLGLPEQRAADGEAARTRNSARRQQALIKLADVKARATHHHRQLDALVQLYYELNHTTFVKLPMRNTMSLLQRIGREQLAHVTDFELRARSTRLQEDETRRAKRRREDEVTQALHNFTTERIETQIELAERRAQELSAELLDEQGGMHRFPDDEPTFEDPGNFFHMGGADDDEDDEDLARMAHASMKEAEQELLWQQERETARSLLEPSAAPATSAEGVPEAELLNGAEAAQEQSTSQIARPAQSLPRRNTDIALFDSHSAAAFTTTHEPPHAEEGAQRIHRQHR